MKSKFYKVLAISLLSALILALTYVRDGLNGQMENNYKEVVTYDSTTDSAR